MKERTNQLSAAVGAIEMFLAWLKTVSGEKCVLCGQKFELDYLAFHHVYGDTKIDTISNLKTRGGMLYILNELPKCVLLCIWCHNRFTSTKDKNKISHISRIKEYHSWYNRPGYIFGWPLNIIIAATIVCREFSYKLADWTKPVKQAEQEYLKACGDIVYMNGLTLP